MKLKLLYVPVFTLSSLLYLGPTIEITCSTFSVKLLKLNVSSEILIGISLFLIEISSHFKTVLIYFIGKASSLSLSFCFVIIPTIFPNAITGAPETPS